MRRTLVGLFLFLAFPPVGGLALAQEEAVVSYRNVQAWESGFQGELTITNPGSRSLTGWTLHFTFSGQIVSSWGGTVLDAQDGVYAVGPASWNASIGPGESTTFGFTATPAGAAAPGNLGVTGTYVESGTGDPGTGGPGEVEDYRITADRDADAFILGRNEPLQIHQQKGQTRTYRFDQAVTSVISRNPSVARTAVVDGAVTVRGLQAGRTGLRIGFAGGGTLFMGLRIDGANGVPPGLPGPVAVGSVSEDGAADLAFWRDHVPGPAGTRMDIRYIYINGGPVSGWKSWDPDRVTSYCKESLTLGLIPFFVFYNIPDGGESYWTDLQHLRDADYMRAYYENLSVFLSEANAVMQGELYGVILEPDLLGYMEQNSGLRPGEITTTDGTLADTVGRINETVATQGNNALFGWQLNLWGDSATGSMGLIRRTDDLGWTAGRAVIADAAQNIAGYAIEAGVLGHGADFLSVDKYGLDAGYVSPDDPARSAWFWNNDHWMNYLLLVKTVHEVSGLPMILWQLPVGHINSSTAVSARTGEAFPDLTNTETKYEDSCASFFFGDAFTEADDARLAYFSGNQAGDAGLSVSGRTIVWREHMRDLPDHGVVAALFGAGVGISTDGVGDPPSDDYFFMQKVQEYYLGLPDVSGATLWGPLFPLFQE